MTACIRCLVIALTTAIVGACGGSDLSAESPVQSVPPLPTNPPVVPEGQISTAEIYVTDSVPVIPGTPVAIVDALGPTLLVARALPINVRWKVSGPFSAPSFPASGFVAFSLTASEWQAIQNVESLRIQPATSTAAGR